MASPIPHYSINDLVGYMVADEYVIRSTPVVAVARLAPVGHITLRPNAGPPTEKLDALLANNDNAKRTYDYQRSDLLDQSPSSYDMALANFAVKAGWVDQEIADLIISFRRRHSLDVAKTMRLDYIQRTIAKARSKPLAPITTRKTAPMPPRETLPPLEQAGPCGIVLTPVDFKKTPTRLTITFELSVDGVATGMDILASDTSGGLNSAWSNLRESLDAADKHLDANSQKQVKDWLRKLLSRISMEHLYHELQQRRQKLTRDQTPDDRPTMQEAALEFMKKYLDLKFVVHEPTLAVWSETMGILLRQSEFTSRVEPGLLKAIENTCDYAAPTASDPTKPIKQVQQVLKTVWCAITGTLPSEVHADLGPNSKAAARFKQAITTLWLTPETWMKFEATVDTPAHVERMSLASRVRSMTPDAARRAPAWQRVLKGVNAFFRVHKEPGQDPVAWLGMRVDLCQGVIKGCVVPGVETQHDLAILAHRYGVADTTDVPVFITEERKAQRLLVLSRSFCDNLIECQDEAEEPPLRPTNPPGATQVIDGSRVDTATGEVLSDP